MSLMSDVTLSFAQQTTPASAGSAMPQFIFLGLMMAAMYGTPEATRFLLEAGADPTLKNQLRLTAADFANRAGRPELGGELAQAARAFERRYRKPSEMHH